MSTPPPGLPLSELTGLVDRVRATTRKLEKVALIGETLVRARGREAELLAMYLTGALPQGRIGVGWSSIGAALKGAPPPSGEPLLLLDVDRAFEALAADRGEGSVQRRAGALRSLFERAGESGRRFLAALLLGEVRQGALDGLVLEALARAAA
ncbi:MAG TPA: ATP-dependent DNA ligase, partial [Vicinamibacteria bacterium]|nr:ATP-dependent DNA ligase [Vicinamibacteria bacterium]